MKNITGTGTGIIENIVYRTVLDVPIDQNEPNNFPKSWNLIMKPPSTGTAF